MLQHFHNHQPILQRNATSKASSNELTPLGAHLVQDPEPALPAAHGIARLDHVPRPAIAAAVFDPAQNGDRSSSGGSSGGGSRRCR